MKVKTVTPGTIADTTIQLIRKGLSNTQILDEVKAKHAGCQTSMACVSWYRAKMRKGLYGDQPNTVPTSLLAKINEAAKAAKAAEVASKPAAKK